MIRRSLLACCLFCLLPALASANGTIRVGAKRFTEGYILGELFAQLIETNTAYRVERRFNLGGTKICVEAITNGAIDLYPEYTGTIQEEILHSPTPLAPAAINAQLVAALQLTIGPSLGFNNTYTLAVRADTAAAGVTTISALGARPELRYGLSHEFLERRDGWQAVAAAYGLHPPAVRGLDHGLAYEALRNGDVDVIDAYSTDAKIARYQLAILDDDHHFFPEYLAVPLWRTATVSRYPELTPLFAQLRDRIDAPAMRALNAAAEIDQRPIPAIVREFLIAQHLVGAAAAPSSSARPLYRLFAEHLLITSIAVAASLLLGIPLGILLTRCPRAARPALALLGLLQTIPSIALLAFMIPLLGIGALPAITALLLYGLLPIVRNTYTGLQSVSPMLREVADAIGLTAWQRLRVVELPLATPMLLAGIKTAAVIAIGTATLAAFIGAGGLGEPIVTGLALNHTGMILRGAIPSALLAIATEYGFILIERCCIPRGLRH
ncbi:MAG: ABC transporter permease subunit [Deltaproteobacteria bacterium]|nr:ABC transporter permease subunit [Deltaproteobacteria bacterium]